MLLEDAEHGQRWERLRPTKIFVGGISHKTTTRTLREHFLQYGDVMDCVVMRNDDGKSRNFGYVTLASDAAARRCLAASNCVDGRDVELKLALRGSRAEVAQAGHKKTHQQKQRSAANRVSPEQTPEKGQSASGAASHEEEEATEEAAAAEEAQAHPASKKRVPLLLAESCRPPPPSVPPPPPPGLSLSQPPSPDAATTAPPSVASLSPLAGERRPSKQLLDLASRLEPPAAGAGYLATSAYCKLDGPKVPSYNHDGYGVARPPFVAFAAMVNLDDYTDSDSDAD
eukprot:TRINITY_DN112388_c0_g1_i1.p1 TRINITY_DN112388_c0_g1~~TRINITY_DN112388_c0_g1_i1.p1  ORF type:complete len:285 (-),score=65.49 TRINITY_DN112388_c0_g1_i1:177-1031(-)